MAKPKSRKQLIEELLDAALACIQTNPPEGFKLPYFQILIMSGRIDEATKLLTEFKSPEPSCKELLKEIAPFLTMPDGPVYHVRISEEKALEIRARFGLGKYNDLKEAGDGTV